MSSKDMAHNIPKLVIKIPPRVGGSLTPQSTLLDPLEIGNSPKFKKIEPVCETKSGVLEFKIEGDRMSPGTVSDF
jgi:hypothetical protein